MAVRPLFCLGFAAVACGAQAKANPDMLNQIADEAVNRNQAFRILRELCTDIGPRVTATENLDRATLWAERKFKTFGLKNVRREQWGTSPVRFQRGKTMAGRMTAPFNHEFTVSAPAYAPGTKGPVRGRVIREPFGPMDIAMSPDLYRGAWVLMDAPGTMSGARRPDQISETEKMLDLVGPAGRVFGSENQDELVWTNGRMMQLTAQTLPTDVRVMVSARDMRILRGQLSIESDVVAEFNLDQKVVAEPTPLYNVIAEIPGSEKPDEMVIVGAHLDSWDTPGSQGASDNGTGSSVVLETARILSKVGAAPKRTMRFILWTGEEQGLLGSQADVAKLRNEGRLERISAVFNEDAGSNWHNGISVIEEQVPMFTEALKPIQAAFPDKEMKINVIAAPPKSLGGSDHTSYGVADVPAFQFGKSGPQRYRMIWHTQKDTWENAVPEGLRHMSANFALTTFGIADAPTLLPRRIVAKPQ